MKFKDVTDVNDNILYGDLTGQTYNGDISVYNKSKKLTSLEGCPKTVNGTVSFADNNLSSLKYAPEFVTGTFDCSNNKKLTSFEGAPKTIGKYFFGEGNPLIKDPVAEVIRCGIQATRYSFGNGIFLTWEDIKKDFFKYQDMKDSIKSKGFRTLLGLDK